MNWFGLLLVIVAMAAMLLLRRLGQISAGAARGLLERGALVIDVRTRGEFVNGHLQKAINIPLDEIAETVPQRYPDRTRTILLHCQSGMRSGVARRRLRGIGYQNAFNLGSYARAMQIVGD